MGSGNQILTQLLFNIETNTANLKKGLDDAKSQFSSLSAGVKQIGGVIAGAFAVSAIVAAGKAVFNFANEIGEANASVRDLTNLTGTALKNTTASILATSNTFKVDFNETLKATNSLVTNYGISFEDASQLVQEGIALQDDDATQLLGIIKQFGPSFKTIGLDAKQSFAIISQAMDSGINADTVAGALGKATQNLRELNANARQALASIGINADELALQIRNGTLTEYEAIQKVSGQMKNFKDDSKEVGDVLINVFGKQGVQAGAQFIESLSTMSTKWSEVLDGADAVEKSNLRIAAAQTEINKELVGLFGETSTYLTELKADAFELALKAFRSVKESVVDIINYFIDLYNESTYFRFVIQETILFFKELWGVVKLVVEQIVNGFTTAGKIVGAIFKGEFGKIPDILNESFKNSAENVIAFGKESAHNFVDAAKAVLSKEKIKLIDDKQVDENATDSAKKFGSTFNSKVNDFLGRDKVKKEKSAKTDVSHLTIPVDLKIKEPNLESLNKAMDKTRKGLQRFKIDWQQFGETVSQSIKDRALPAASQLGQQLGDMATIGKASFADVANAALNSAKGIIAASLSQALASSIAANSALPFPLDAIAIAAATGIVTAAFNSLPAFENGGVSQGGLSLVGEKGAELVNLPAGARVYNNRDTSNILSGSNKLQLEVKTVGVKNDHIWFAFKEADRKRNNTI